MQETPIRHDPDAAEHRWEPPPTLSNLQQVGRGMAPDAYHWAMAKATRPVPHRPEMASLTLPGAGTLGRGRPTKAAEVERRPGGRFGDLQVVRRVYLALLALAVVAAMALIVLVVA